MVLEDPLAGPSPRCWPGPRRAHFLRGGAPRPAPGRPGRVRGRRWLAASAARFTATPSPRTRRFPGPWTEYSLRPLSPSSRGGRDGAPSPPARLSTGADCPQCAPTASRRSGRGPAHATGARGRRRCRLPTRPVLKHGPRSLTRARVRGCGETPRRNESEGRRAPAEVGSWAPRGLPGAPPARLARSVGEVEHERVR